MCFLPSAPKSPGRFVHSASEAHGAESFYPRQRNPVEPLWATFLERMPPSQSGCQDWSSGRVLVARAPRAALLLRYMDIAARDRAAAIKRVLNSRDASGRSLREKILAFGTFVGDRVDSEREELLRALEAMHTGDIYATSEADLDPSERSTRREGPVLPNVRLANGGGNREIRRRLMSAFNTPFFPEVLVASSVMAEGVDLHLHCRHAIHHDLDWNPSTLEQRTAGSIAWAVMPRPPGSRSSCTSPSSRPRKTRSSTGSSRIASDGST
jgi:hypothetical protein